MVSVLGFTQVNSSTGDEPDKRAYRLLFSDDDGVHVLLVPFDHPNLDKLQSLLIRLFDNDAGADRQVDAGAIIHDINEQLGMDADGSPLPVLPLLGGNGLAVRYGNHVLIGNEPIDPALERYLLDIMRRGEQDMNQGFGTNEWNDIDWFIENLYGNPNATVRNKLFTWMNNQYSTSLEHGFTITNGHFIAYTGEDDNRDIPDGGEHRVGILDHALNHANGDILIVEVNPRDVTMVHNVYDAHTVSCTKYRVIGRIPGGERP